MKNKTLKKVAYILNTKNFDKTAEYVFSAICSKIEQMQTLNMSKDDLMKIVTRLESSLKPLEKLILFSQIKEFKETGLDFFSKMAIWFYKEKIILYQFNEDKVVTNTAVTFLSKESLVDHLYDIFCSKPKLDNPHPEFTQTEFAVPFKIRLFPQVEKMIYAFLKKIKPEELVSVYYPNIGAIVIKKENNLFSVKDRFQDLPINEATTAMLDMLKDEVYNAEFYITDHRSFLDPQLMSTTSNVIIINVRPLWHSFSLHKTSFRNVVEMALHHELTHLLQYASNVCFGDEVLLKHPDLYGTTKKIKDSTEGVQYEFSPYLSGLANLARKKYEIATPEEKNVLEKLLTISDELVPENFLYLKKEFDRVTKQIKDPEVKKKVIIRYLQTLKG